VVHIDNACPIHGLTQLACGARSRKLQPWISTFVACEHQPSLAIHENQLFIFIADDNCCGICRSDCALALHEPGVVRSRGQGMLAGTLLLGTPLYVAQTAAQYADIPFGFFVLAALVLGSLFNACKAAPGLLSIAGVTCGLACWTKTEGWFFLIAVLIGRFAFPGAQFSARDVRRQMLSFLSASSQ
jgi:hypothetical protein